MTDKPKAAPKPRRRIVSAKAPKPSAAPLAPDESLPAPAPKAPRAKAKKVVPPDTVLRCEVLAILDGLAKKCSDGFSSLGHGDIIKLKKQIAEL